MSRALLAKIHIAKKELALPDESYRAILARIAGKESSAQLTDREVDMVLGEFKRLGWRPKAGAKRADRPHVRKVYALWRHAEDVGAIEDGSRDALRAFVIRQTGGCSTPEFLTPPQANKVVEGLKAMIKRKEADHG